MNIIKSPDFSQEEFSQLLEESLKNQPKEGSIVEGKVVSISNNAIFIDVGLKSEGRVPSSEFLNQEKLFIGSKVEVYVDRLEGKNGCAQLSRDKVAKEMTWNKFEKLNASNGNIDGKIIGKVNKGGYAVRIEGILAFLPGSQLDIRPVKDPLSLMNIKQSFKILKTSREQGNLVVSRRAVLEDSRKEAKEKLLTGVKEGMIFNGVVKNITNYGAFIDLGDIDGLLHITDISWDKISHPSEKITLGQPIKVVVIKYNSELRRVSLGLKQLSKNTWKGLEKKYKIGTKHRGKIVSISSYGAFVELDKSIEGLVYLNEISWNVKNVHPKKLISIGDEVKVIILNFDIGKHRISLSIKKCMKNPWKMLIDKYSIGSKVKIIVNKIVDFGLFVNLLENNTINNLDILIPIVEIDWKDSSRNVLKKYKVGDCVEGLVINSDLTNEKVIISIKQLENINHEQAIDKLIKLDFITCKILSVNKEGLLVETLEGIKGFVQKYDLSKRKYDQKLDGFIVGDKIDVKAISYNQYKKVMNFSIKALEIIEEKQAIAKYGSSNIGANIGDILEAAIKKQNNR